MAHDGIDRTVDLMSLLEVQAENKTLKQENALLREELETLRKAHSHEPPKNDLTPPPTSTSPTSPMSPGHRDIAEKLARLKAKGKGVSCSPEAAEQRKRRERQNSAEAEELARAALASCRGPVFFVILFFCSSLSLKLDQTCVVPVSRERRPSTRDQRFPFAGRGGGLSQQDANAAAVRERLAEERKARAEAKANLEKGSG